MDIHLLAGTRLFQGIREHEIEAMLTCLSAEERTYGKDAYIYLSLIHISEPTRH